ncbi:MAG: hypothetical protein JWQ38_2793 [Flavipsychrobacter sp.]|nr:hypothetical protein [Flavipsychrobacter sp.]
MSRSKSKLKKEIEDCFTEMEELTKKAEYALMLAKKYPEAGSVVGEAEELMRKWSDLAKKYVTLSKDYHNLVFDKIPI